MLLGDMNGKAESNEITGVKGKWGVGVNENDEHLVDICGERRHIWRRDKRGEQKTAIDYVAVDKRLRKDVLDTKVVRRTFEGLDHYAMLTWIKMRGTWEYGKRKDKVKGRQVIVNGRSRTPKLPFT